MRTFLFEWKKKLGYGDNVYAYRWRLDFWYFSFRVHKWLCSDDMRAYHSHPVNMLVWVLKGRYYDWRLIAPGMEDRPALRVFNRWQLRYIPRGYKHYIEIKESPTYTLLFTWGSPDRYAFYDKTTGKKYWRDKWFAKFGHHICN